MSSSFHLAHRRFALLSLALPFAVLATLACGDDDDAADGTDATDGDGSGDGGAGDGDGDGSDDADASPGDQQGLGPERVDLGSATDPASARSFAVLAKTGITNVTGSAITGANLGVSPSGASSITGFSLVADTTNVFATSIAVVTPARVYASDYAVPTPTNLVAAVVAMEAAYADAAGRLDPDVLDLAGGEIGGETLAPGLYTWGTGVTIPDDLTISGGANDVWIFQIAQDLDLSSATSITLAGGARARNIFWQVAGTATIHENAHFEGIILSGSSITLQTNATMQGCALAQSLVALDDNDITAP